MSDKKPATVIHILEGEERIVINRGSKDEIKKGDRFLIYSVGKELYDPETRLPLGKLEIVKGTGKVVHVQEKMATIESDTLMAPSKTITKRKGAYPYITSTSFEEEIIDGNREVAPFENPDIGDKAKQI